MQIRYFIEYKLQHNPADGHHYYQPMGVLAQGMCGGLNVCGLYLPTETEAQEKADWVINNLVESGAQTLPADWLQRKAADIGLYKGDASPIYMADGLNADKVAERVLALIISGKPFGDPPLPLTKS